MKAERGRPRGFNREAALQQAMEVFWERGYESTSVAALAAAMNINPPSLYAAFGDKEALFREAVAHYRAADGSLTGKALREAPTAREAVEGMLMMAAHTLTLPDKPNGCLVVLGATNCSPSSRPVDVFLHDVRMASVRDIRARLADAVANAELPPDSDIEQMTAYFVTVLHGMSLQARDGVTRQALEGVVRMAMATWPAPHKTKPPRKGGRHLPKGG
ncbi:TetR/AcrR family transcriptional regulator [Trinickia sp. LjRoot230]|uniref:TetR/AcrR family transcriptional regulator n=1 Tax=Trinickia sp. LjRoot230 TaxID=3342288 RepID=UPI003ED09DE5